MSFVYFHVNHAVLPSFPWSRKTRVSKRAPREFRNWRVQGNPLTLRQPFANLSPTFRQPFANPLPTFSAKPLSKPLFPYAPGTRLETRVNGFLVFVSFEKGKEIRRQNTDFLIPTEPLKSLEKKGEALKKTRISSEGETKNKEFKKKQGKEGQGSHESGRIGRGT